MYINEYLTKEKFEDLHCHDYEGMCFVYEQTEVRCFPRKLSENLNKINSTDLHLWMYLTYSQNMDIHKFQCHLGLSNDQISMSLNRLKDHNLMGFNQESGRWYNIDGLNFVF